MLDSNNLQRTRLGHLLCAAHTLSLCGAVAFALAVARPALAQSDATVNESKAATKNEAVRERRTTAEGVEAKENGDASKDKGETLVSKADAPEDAALEELKTKIKDAKSDAERARLRRALAEHLAENGRKAEAVAELREMLDDERFDPTGFYNVGNALARLDESNAAVEAYRKAVTQRRGNYSRAQHNLGVVLIRLGRLDEAQEALTAALRLEGGVYPEASYNLGRLYALRGEAGLAIAEWTRALSHQPDHMDAAVALARALAEDGDPDRAIAVLDTFGKRATRRGASTSRAIDVARGEIVAAVNVMREAESDAPVRLEKTFAGSARPVAASSAKTPLRALAVDQQTYDLLRRARTAREGQHHDEAIQIYRRVIERRGGYFAPANIELGYSLLTLRRNPEAIEALQSVATKDGPRYPVASYHLGRLHESAGDLAQSREAFKRAVTFYGEENPQPLLDLARVYEKLGDLRGASETLETYVRLTSRLGATPDWATQHLAELRQKLAAASAQEKK